MFLLSKKRLSASDCNASCPGRNDADIVRRVDGAAGHRAAALLHLAFALAAAQADADLDAGAIDALRCSVVQLLAFCRQAHRRQRLHARVAGFAGSLGQAADAVGGIDDGRIHAAAKRHLAERCMLLAAIAVVAFLDQHLLADDADVASVGQHLAGRLRVVGARAQRYIWVVLAIWMSRPAVATSALLAEIVPPILLKSFLVATPTASPSMRPPRLWTFSAVRRTI